MGSLRGVDIEVKSGGMNRGNKKGHNKTFGRDGYLHYLDCGDDFMFTNTSNLPNCAH